MTQITSQRELHAVMYRGEFCTHTDTKAEAIDYVRRGMEAGNWRAGYDIVVQDVVEIRSTPRPVEFAVEDCTMGQLEAVDAQ